MYCVIRYIAERFDMLACMCFSRIGEYSICIKLI